MNRVDLVKQAFTEAWEGYEEAINDIEPDTIGRVQQIHYPSTMVNLSPIAAQIYRQLSSVTYIKIPPGLDVLTKDLLVEILKESGVNYIVLPNSIETIPTDEDGT